jgi:hypothetical protein
MLLNIGFPCFVVKRLVIFRINYLIKSHERNGTSTLKVMTAHLCKLQVFLVDGFTLNPAIKTTWTCMILNIIENIDNWNFQNIATKQSMLISLYLSQSTGMSKSRLNLDLGWP